MKDKDLAIQNYKKFCEYEGSEYIASEFALEIILRIIKKYNISSILELGLGIGSISDTILEYAKKENKKITYVGTEKNEFCLNALKQNVADYDQIHLYSELNQIGKEKFDLIIIDGYDETLKGILSFCKENTIIFVEGDRRGQTETVLDVFKKSKYVNIITLNKNKPYAHGDCNSSQYVGGGQLIFTNPSFNMKLFWIKEKALTFIKRKMRTYSN